MTYILTHIHIKKRKIIVMTLMIIMPLKNILLLLSLNLIFAKIALSCDTFTNHWNQDFHYNGPLSDSTCCYVLDITSSHEPSSSESPWSELMIYWGYGVVALDLGLYMPDDASSPVELQCGIFANLDTCNGYIRNHATPQLDLGFIYGNTAEQQDAVRVGENSCMIKMTATGQFPRTCNRTLFPSFTNNDFGYSNSRCTSDPRSSLTPQVLALHTLLALEHNRRCSAHHSLFPGHQYFTIKRDMIALAQKITMYEWLPAMVGGLDRIPPFIKKPRDATSGQQQQPRTSFEFELVLKQSWLSGVSGDVQHQSLNGMLSSEPLNADFYDGNALQDSADGICGILIGSKSTPMQNIARSLSQPWYMYQYYYENTCHYSAAYNIPSYQQAVNLSLVMGHLLYPTVNTSELRQIHTLEDITDDPTIGDYLEILFGYDAANTTEKRAALIDLWTGLLLEKHGPLDDDVLGPLARYILITQMVAWRDKDADYFENFDDLQKMQKNNLFNILNRHCDRYMQYHKKLTSGTPTFTMQTQPFDLLTENMQQMHTVNNSVSQTIDIVIIILVTFFCICFLYTFYDSSTITKIK